METLTSSSKESKSSLSLSEKENTLIHYFLKWEKDQPNEVFLNQPVDRIHTEYSWKEVGEEARKITASLQSKGYKKGDKIAFLSANCAQWIIYDLAIMLGGYVSVPLYANVNASTMQAILKHSESKCLFIGKLNQEDWQNVKDHIPAEIEKYSMNGYDKEGVPTYNEFIAEKGIYKAHLTSPEDVLTIIYTSGTTGMPKGVVHTNQSIMNAIHAAKELALLDIPGNRFISYLPLSHAAERGLIEGGSIFCGGRISFVEKQETFVQDVQRAQVTHFFGVPRIWEKIQSNILQKLPQRKLDIMLSIPFLSSFIKRKIKKSLGLDNAKIVLSGAAPIAKELLQWYKRIGIEIREAYGMTENFNVLSINPEGKCKPGSVGILYNNEEIKIDPDSKEIIQKCSWLMQEYYKQGDITSDTIKDGWLHTGDQGRMDEDGYLYIIGRVKDIFKTSKGEYITPAPIESEFLAIPWVDQACVLGSIYPQPFILIVLSEGGKPESKEKISNVLSSTLDLVNSNLMKYQQLSKVIVVSEEWTLQNDLLTPSLKIKRAKISEKYESQMKALVDSENKVEWEH